ncbi:hypothetical protein JCM30204_22360 [Dysgonomonas termitidis]
MTLSVSLKIDLTIYAKNPNEKPNKWINPLIPGSRKPIVIEEITKVKNGINLYGMVIIAPERIPHNI